jgi:hypothetical protein
MVQQLVRSGLKALARGGSSWVPACSQLAARGSRAPFHGSLRLLECRGISSSGGNTGAGLQQQAATARVELDKNGSAASEVVGQAFRVHAVNGKNHQRCYGDAHAAANRHDSNAHKSGVNGANGVHNHNLAASAGTHTREASEHARDVILGGAAALKRLAAVVDETFEEALAMIERRSPGSRVIVVGIGKSGHLARKVLNPKPYSPLLLSHTGEPEPRNPRTLCPNIRYPHSCFVIPLTSPP